MTESRKIPVTDPEADQLADEWWDEQEKRWQEAMFADWLAQTGQRDCDETRRLWRHNGWRGLA